MGFDFKNVPNPGDVSNGYTWDGEKWTMAGGGSSGGGAPPSTANPKPLGTPAPGVATPYSREDHVHQNVDEQALPYNCDFNTIARGGRYYTVDAASTNVPLVGYYWWLSVEFYTDSANYVKQVATPLAAPGIIYVRVKLAGVWQPWRIVLDTGAQSLTAAQQAQVHQNIGASAGYNNIVVNGRMEVAQFTSMGATYTLTSGVTKYLCDGWAALYSHAANTAVITGYPDNTGTLFPAPAGFSTVLGLYSGVAMSSPANGDTMFFYQFIEGTRIAKLSWGTTAAQPLSYAFMLFVSFAGVGFIRFNNNPQSRFFYQEFTCVAGWNFISGTIPGDTTGAWVTTSAVSLTMAITITGKAATPVAPGSWGASYVQQTTNSQNLAPTNTSTTALSGFLLVAGSSPPQSQAALAAALTRPFDEELLLCKRYYEKSYNYTVLPGASGAPGYYAFPVPTNSLGANFDYGPLRFQVAKRGVPTVTIYGASGSAGQVSRGTDAADLGVNSGVGVGVGETGCIVRNGSGTTITTANLEVLFHYVADVRM